MLPKLVFTVTVILFSSLFKDEHSFFPVFVFIGLNGHYNLFGGKSFEVMKNITRPFFLAAAIK
jgi:hypothetical protein